MDFREFLQQHIVLLDGGMGTLLQERGLMPGERPERWNLSHPEDVAAIHRAYFDAGSNVVNTNTFGANTLHFDEPELEQIIFASVENAKTARDTSIGSQQKFIALDIGPTGRLLKPMGDLDFEDAVEVFSRTVRIGVQAGVDLIMIETMNDSYETKAALLAAKENSSLPVIVSNAYSENGKLMTGADPLSMIAMLEGMGADAIGMNCSFGPDRLAPIVREYVKYASVPVLLKPNAGLPRSENGKTLYDIPADRFADICVPLVREGVRLVGGCCGTTPDYISALSERISALEAQPITDKQLTVISSYSHAVVFSDDPVLIGERINPTGKKRLKEALRANDLDYILTEALRQQDAGAQVLDVNVGLPEIDEPKVLAHLVGELQAVTDLPLQIDTSDPVALERALRRYNGKAMVNSVNGKAESMNTIFPLMKKYGGVAVALTLDEGGIPATAEGRFRIAEKIVSVAESYGISRKDLVFDTLAMAVSADQNAAKATIGALSRIRRDLGVHTSLGVSNVSFGLPRRDVLNAGFFMAALSNGLSAAIMNPFSTEMMKTYYAYRLMAGLDENCAEYIRFCESLTGGEERQTAARSREEQLEQTLSQAIIRGMRDRAAVLCREQLAVLDPLDIVNDQIIPALDRVGTEYEQGAVYLPGLLMAAEASKAAFEEIKKVVAASDTGVGKKCRFVIATVKGDIHDIGKNIVKLLLENYGFEVTDLGKDVDPQLIVDTVIDQHAPLVGLSALMTTTVPSMEQTIVLLREQAPWAKVVVGGAVMNEEYAAAIGADKYAADAMDTVRYADEINGHLA